MTLPRLYVIADAEACAHAGWALADFARACLDAGARLFQLRAKAWPSGRLLDEARSLVEQTEAAGARVIVNDRADVARIARAAGVHVGQDDLPPPMARAIVGPDAIVGFSTHSTVQVDLALREPLSYVAVGPVFGTATKDTGYAPVGLDLVRYADRAGHAMPVVAIGGITLANAPSVIEAGAASVAAIGDLLATGNPGARVRAFLKALGE